MLIVYDKDPNLNSALLRVMRDGLVVSVSAHVTGHSLRPVRVIPKTITKMVQTASLLGTQT